MRRNYKMSFLTTLATFLQIIVAVITMILVLLQDSKEDGNIVTGSSNQGGAMGASRDEKLAKLTKWFGILFFILTIVSSTLILLNRA